MKKILILTVTAGNGHNSVARSIANDCKSDDCEVKVVDTLKDLGASKSYVWVNDRGYGLACTYLCWLFNWFFRRYQKCDPKKANKNTVQKGPRKLYGKLLQLVMEFQPDVIYCTHYIPAMMLTNLRKIYNIPAKICAFHMDFCIQPFFECVTGVDRFFVMHEEFIQPLVEKGFSESRMMATGLPVAAKFSAELDKKEARRELGMDENKFTIFVMFGGGMWSGNYKIAKTIIKHIQRDDVQIVIANGKDEKSKKKIDKLKKKSKIDVYNFGFCNNVDVIMSASDVLVGKGGGISLSEALNKRLPVLACKKMPEQEVQNIKTIERAGCGRKFSNGKELVKILEELISDPEKLQAMKNATEKLRKPHAMEEAVKFSADAKKVKYPDEQIDYSKAWKNVKKMLKGKSQKSEK